MTTLKNRTLLPCLLALLTSFAATAADTGPDYATKALAALSRSAASPPKAGPEVKEKAVQSLNSGKLLFVENNGQLADGEGKPHPEIVFTAKAGGARVYVTRNSIHYVFTKVEKEINKNDLGRPDQRDSIKLVRTHRFTVELEGANRQPELVKQEANPYYENYYLAHCPQGVMAHSYEKFMLKGVYPGVDWVVYSNGQGLKYDFVLAKASDASQIRLKIREAESHLSHEGDLVMQTSLGEVTEDKPVSVQSGQKLETSFVELGKQVYGFVLPYANANQPITIDPSVEWATYFGGSNQEQINSCATDPSSNVYLAGYTSSTNFPVAGAFQGTYGGGYDAFLVKFSSTGSRLWATYYGGDGRDEGLSCATDASGNVYLSGNTLSTNLPVAGAFQATYAGGNSFEGGDAFLAKFNMTGIRQWATYYGGMDDEFEKSCATDASGNVYLAGETASTNFPVAGAFQGTYGGGTRDAFLVKFTGTGIRQWATYYGGSEGDYGRSCATDASGNVYLAGGTYSGDFPVGGAFQGTYGGGTHDAFLVKLSSTGSHLWATYYGGRDFDIGYSCATDASGNVYLAGQTTSTNFPVAGAFQGTYGGRGDAFLVKFSSIGNRFWATYYGGDEGDRGYSCAPDASGDVYLAGYTGSSNFPVTGAFQGTYGDWNDAFLVKFSSTGSRFWATYCGGSSYDYGNSCATDPSGNVYLAGETYSGDFPVAGAFQTTYAGNFDAFLVKFAGTISSLATQTQTPTLELSPNPTSNTLYLKLSHGEIQYVEIIDPLGRTLLSLPRPAHNTLNLEGLPSSTYILKVRHTGGVLQRRVVKQ